MRSRRLFDTGFIWVLLLASAGLAQVDEEMRVVQRQVSVYVVDDQGVPITGLTADDFKMVEDGVPQEISFFQTQTDLVEEQPPSETQADNTAVSQEERANGHWVIVLDSSNMTSPQFESMIAQTKDLIGNRLKDDVFVKIVQLEDRMVHLTEITRDRHHLLEALDSAQYKGSSRKALASLESRVVDAIDEYRRQLGLRYDAGQDSAVFLQQNEDEYIIAMLADRILDAVVEKERFKKNAFRTYYLNMLALAEAYSVIQAPKTVLYMTAGLHLDSGVQYSNTRMQARHLAQMLNQADMTIHACIFDASRPAGYQAVRSAQFSTMGEFDLLEKLSVQADKKYIADRLMRHRSGNSVYENVVQQAVGPESQAEHTGGWFVHCKKPELAGEAFASLLKRIGRPYRLGYISEVEQPKSIKVKIDEKDRGWQVTYGKKLRALPKAKQSDQLQMLVEMTLLYDDSFRNDLDAAWGYHLFEQGPESFVVSTQIRFGHRMTLIEGYRFGFALLDENGDPLDVVLSRVGSLPKPGVMAVYDVLVAQERPQQLRFLAENLDTGDRLLVQEALHIAQQDSAFGPVLVSGTPPDMAAFLHQSRYTHSNLESDRHRVEMDPLRSSGQTFLWDPEAKLKPGQDQLVLFQMRRPWAPETNQIQFLAQTEGPTASLKPLTCHVTKELWQGLCLCRAAIPGVSLTPGTQGLMIQYQASDSKKLHQRRVHLNMLEMDASDNQAALNRALLNHSMKSEIKDLAAVKMAVSSSDRNWKEKGVQNLTKINRKPSSSGQWQKEFKRLIREGADIHAQDEEGNQVLSLALLANEKRRVMVLLEAGASVNHANRLGVTPLMIAATLPSDDYVRILLKHGAVAELSDVNSNTPLHYAAENQRLQAAQALLEAGASPELKNNLGQTPYYVAASKGFKDLTELLYREAMDANQIDKMGYTALHRATYSADRSHLQLLLNQNADLEAVDAVGNTPILVAAMAGASGAVNDLADLGAQVNATNAGGENAAMMAATYGHANTLRYLAKAGVDLAYQVRGVNALMLAAANGHMDAVKTLIDLGMDPGLEDDEGQTALDHARQNEQDSIAEYLEDQMGI